MLSIKTGDFPLHQQKLQGFVVGFKVGAMRKMNNGREERMQYLGSFKEWLLSERE